MLAHRVMTIDLEDQESAIGLDDAVEEAHSALGAGPLAAAIRDARAALVRMRAVARRLEGHVGTLEDEGEEIEHGIDVVHDELDTFPYALALRVELDRLFALRGPRLRKLVASLDAVLELVVMLEGSTLTIKLDEDTVTADAARRALLEGAARAGVDLGTLPLPGMGREGFGDPEASS